MNFISKDHKHKHFIWCEIEIEHFKYVLINFQAPVPTCSYTGPLPTRGFPGHYPACTLGAMKNLIKLMMKILLEYPGIPSAWAAHFPHAANLGEGGPLCPNLGSQIHWFWDALSWDRGTRLQNDVFCMIIYCPPSESKSPPESTTPPGDKRVGGCSKPYGGRQGG